jgi:hypothetical protein
MILIENISTSSLMAYQQILEMSSVHFKEASDDLIAQHKANAIGITFRDNEINLLEAKYIGNEIIGTNIQKELDRRIFKAFGKQATSGVYVDRLRVRFIKEIETHKNLLKDRTEKGAEMLKKRKTEKPVKKLNLTVSKEKKITKK